MSAVKTRPKVTARALAWLAEAAHGRQGVKLYVYEDKNGKLVVADKNPGQDKEPVLEIEVERERPPLIRAHKIALQVRADTPERNLLDDEALPFCDALFWTASSIEKFLFPYYHAQRLYSQADICGLMESYRGDTSLVAAAHVAPSKEKMIRTLETAGFLRLSKTERNLEFIGFTEYLRR